MKHTRLPRYLALILALVAMLVPFVAFAQESNPTGPDVLPDLVYGNPTCASLNADNANFPEITSNFGFKINLAPNGKFVFQTVGTGFELTGSAPTDLTNSVTIFNSNGIKFDWLATLGIDAVIVKAQDANAYVYAPEALTDNGLVAPGTNKEISHIEFCYDYELTATKTANATYTRTFTWGIVKSVDVDNHSGFPGDQFTSNYVVDVYQTVVDSDFAVSGEITVNNPTPFEVNFSVADSVGGIAAAVVCPTYSLAPGTGTTCTYSVDLGDTLPANGTNTATITSNTTDVGGASANADYTFGDPTNTDGDAEVNINDSVKGLLGPASGNQPFAYSHDFACSTNPADYTDGIDTDTYPNKATIAETGQSDSESVTVSCTLPALQVSKTAAGSYDRTVTWSLTKSVDDDSHSGIVGGVAGSSTWTVVADKTETFDNYKVIGTITINNPAPIAQTFTIGDVLNDSTVATVNCPKYMASPGETVVCTYEAKPQGDAATNNVATVTAVGNAPRVADADVSFTGKLIGYDSGTLKDPRFGYEETIAGDTTETFPETFLCPADAGLYVDGKYTRDEINTATIIQTGQSDSASVVVNCYAPVISKTAAGTYDEVHDWTVVKTVSPASQSAFAGDKVNYEWTVTVEEKVSEANFKVDGVITVVNPAPMDMTVALADVLEGGTAASIGDADCTITDGMLLVPAGATVACDYLATPTDKSATLNAATATLKGIDYVATDPIEWTANVIRGSASLDDEQNPNLPPSITEGGTWKYEESYTCSTDMKAYGADTHNYTFSERNIATVKDGETTLSFDDASTAVNCYMPTISKTAFGTYDEVHDWEVFKSGAAAQKKFAGDKAGFNWTVRVDETTHGENYSVTGDITVINPNPEDALTVSLSDVLNDGSGATITGCTGGTWASPNLTVPAGGTAVCDYAVAPRGDLAAFAAALPDTVTEIVAYPGPDSYFLTTLSNGGPLNGTYEGWCVDTDHYITPGTSYTSKVYSSYEALPAGLVEHPENFDLVNWIINQEFVGKPAGAGLGNYTYGDVQRAIWELVEDTVTASITYNTARVAQIRSLAAAHEGYVPTCGDFIAVVLEPVNGAQPITIGQVTFASLGVNCATSNAVTAVLNGIEFPASADILWTPKPVNPTATLDDSQNPAWADPITVSEDKTFTYVDPQGYVCPADPAAYAGDGIAPVYTDSNTATLTYTGGTKSATASTSVTCYAPVVSKTATAEWKKKYDWTITKTADPASHSGFAGDSFTSAYDVFVDQTVTVYGFLASGTISVKNPTGSPGAMTVDVADMVNGGFAATVDCEPETTGDQASVVVAANATKTCAYRAELPDNSSRVNTATGTFKNIGFTATANVVFGDPIIEGYPTINVTDNVQGTLGTAGEDKHFTYSKEFNCSTDPLDYTAFADSDTYGNVATIDQTGQRDDASVTVDCFIPEISKTAAGTYDERHDWTVEKSVYPLALSGFAGDTVFYDWTVVVTEDVFEENFKVAGDITVVNHSPDDAMTVALSDVLSDEVVPTITACTGDTDLRDGLTVGAGGSSVCDYSTALEYSDDAAAPTGNTATATLNAGTEKAIAFVANAPIKWTPTFIRDSALLDDDQNPDPAWPLNITEGGSWTYSDHYTCSSVQSEYGTNGKHSFTVSNTAIVSSDRAEQDRATATESIDCYAPVVSKTVETYFNRDWDWTITKDFDATYNLFAGESVTHDYTVSVSPTKTDNFWGVKGEITVVNNHPTQAMTLASISDDAGGIAAAVSCPEALETLEALVVPAAGSLVCTYDTGEQDIPGANPFGALNVATAAFADASWTGSAPIIFSPVPTTEDQPVITVDDDNLTGEAWSADRVGDAWTYTKDFACSASPDAYKDGSYTYSHLNTATIVETKLSDGANVTVNCYAPVVSKTVQTYFNRDWDWTITKDANATYSLFAGESVEHKYKVAVTPSHTDSFWGVKGEITVANHHPTQDMTLTSLSDLAGGITAAVTCPNLIVPADNSLTCTYDTGPQTAPNDNPFGALNVATAAFADASWTGSAPISFSANPTTEDQPVITVDDDKLTGEAWSADRIAVFWEYTKVFACSTDPKAYTNGTYSYSLVNKATINEQTSASGSAKVDVNCFAPVVTKTATGSYDETHTWKISKSVDSASLSGYAGDTLNWKWTVNVSESYVESNFLVSGKISVYNPSLTAMVVTLSDALDDGTVAKIGPCTIEGSAASDPLEIAAGKTAVCGYVAVPVGRAATKNVVTVTFNTIPFSAEAGVTFAKNVINGTADVDDLIEGDFPATLIAGQGPWEWTEPGTHTCSTSRTAYGANGTYGAKLDNTATVTASDGQTDSASASTTYTCKAGFVDLLKLTNGVEHPTLNWNFTLYEGPNGFDTSPQVVISSDNTPPSLLDFGGPALRPDTIYTLCELSVPAGWSSHWLVATASGDATVLPYNPNSDDDVPGDLGNRCVDFGANTLIPFVPEAVDATLHFKVNNSIPGGDPRTPGYWKNWNTCTGGGQAASAAANGGWEAGFWLLDDVLVPTIGGGIVWDDILPDSFTFPITECDDAVKILDDRDIVTDKKMSSDPGFTLAKHLFAAELNWGAGACVPYDPTTGVGTPVYGDMTIVQVAIEAEKLLDGIDYDGVDASGIKKGDAALALSLAKVLDQYNNGMFCGSTYDPAAMIVPMPTPLPTDTPTATPTPTVEPTLTVEPTPTATPAPTATPKPKPGKGANASESQAQPVAEQPVEYMAPAMYLPLVTQDAVTVQVAVVPEPEAVPAPEAMPAPEAVAAAPAQQEAPSQFLFLPTVQK